MQLKRLEIIGFKSFVEKTVISFDKDVSAVVGPNGCGKSNIVDAIRWVMGEMSAKHLRGKQMEDVIFAGSETRPPLSMASVELTFSTEGYQTPADYLNHSEVSICRRLYRMGESEYFINKTPVRLKDITDLFLGTGVGTKAYSIIEQGRVGQIITAKPEERRYFIEEVAGISKFKSRKEAALRKMEATTQNMLRLSDIINELEKQHRSLDRQAKKAEKYKEVKTEFDRLDLAVSSFDYSQASQKQSQLEGELRQLDEQETLCKAGFQEEENLVEALRLGIIEKERGINEVQNNLFEVTNYIRLSESKLNYKKEDKQRLLTRMEELQKNIEEKIRETQGLKNGLVQINDQKMNSDFEEEKFREQTNELEILAQNTYQQVEEISKQVELLIGQIHSAQNRLAEVKTHQVNSNQKKKELDQSIQVDQTEISKVEKQHYQLSRSCKEATQGLESLRQLKLDLNVKTEELANRLQGHEQNLAEQEKELTGLKEELTLRKSRLTSLEELQKNFEGYQQGTRSILLKHRESQAEGIFGAVADFVETEPQYEGAVSAVLGEKLQYVVVKSHQEGVEAIDYLRQASGGRTSFIPMEVRTYAGDSGEIPMQEGVLGPLKKFISIKGNHDRVAEFLFGDVVLVDTLKRALDVWTANGHRKTLVTLQGEVVDPSGMITGGNLEAASKALLEKKREIKELYTLIESLENDFATKEQQKNYLVKQVGALKASLEHVKSNSVEEEIKIAHQAKDIDHLKKELDAMLHKKEEIALKLKTNQQNLAQLEKDLEAFHHEEQSLGSQLEVWQKEILGKKKLLEDLNSQYSQNREALTHKKVELAQSAERNGYLESEITRLQQEIFKLRIQLTQLEKESEISVNQADRVDGERAHLTKMLEKKLVTKTKIDAEFQERKEAYDAENQKIREKEGALKEKRQLLEKASARLNQVTIFLTEVRGEMKHWVEQCLERHQIHLPDVYQQYLSEDLNLDEARARVKELRMELSKMGDVNTAALTEYEEITQRLTFLKTQYQDLEASLKSLERVIQKINQTTKERFLKTFHLVNDTFKELFPKLFRGGRAELMLTDEQNLLETGVDIIAQPPGKKLQSISLLSGGEKAMSAISLIFSIFKIKPSPFCLLDEVDAPLDDANVGRYNDIIREMTNKTQFIVITHNKRTMEMADVLYGVTMQEAGVSQIVSVDLAAQSSGVA